MAGFTYDEEILDKITQRNKLFVLDNKSEKQEEELRQLSEELASLGCKRNKKVTLSADEIRERNQKADEILEELFDEDEK